MRSRTQLDITNVIDLGERVTVYDRYPEHPLHGVPAEVLAAARSAASDAATWKDIDFTDIEPVADAVIATALQSIREWLADGLEDRAGALRTDDFRSGRASIEYINGIEYAAHYVREAPKPTA